MEDARSPHDRLYAEIRGQLPTLLPEELQTALDVALALRSTLEAAGHTHEEIVAGADQVTNELIAQWVAEDSNQLRMQQAPSEENTEEEAHTDDLVGKCLLR